MKFKTFTYTFIFLVSIQIYGQVDRSKAPDAGPVPSINIEKPQTFELKNGIKVMVVESHKLPRVSYTLRIDNNPIPENDKSGVSAILSSMLGNATTSISKENFNSEIDYLGANLSFGSQSANASGLSKYSDRILELMADAAINPLLDMEEFKSEKAKLIETIKNDDKNVASMANRLSTALSYGKNHPYGEFITVESLENINYEDVLTYYNTYFKPNNAYLVIVGDVEFKSIKKKTESTFGKWEKTEPIDIALVNPESNPRTTEIDFLEMPNAVQTNIIISNTVDLNMNDEDYFPALIASAILGGGGTGYLFQNLREDKGYTYGSYSNIDASRYGASRFSATAEVRNEVTDSSVVEMLKEIKRIKNEAVDQETLANAKAEYLGRFFQAIESPQTIASFALNTELNDLDENFYKNYLARINDVTAEDVQRVANKYFKNENARIVIAGKGADILENLEKTGIPIKYFDKYANATDKPSFSKPLPSNVTASSVITNYIEKLGGKEELESINSIVKLADVTIQGMPFQPKAVMKEMVPNKLSLEMNIEGMGTVMKQKFDGTKGYREQQGVKADMTPEEITIQKNKKGLFPELYFDTNNVELTSLTTIEGTDAYKIKVSNETKESYRYYAVDSGFLIRTEETNEVQGQSITSITDTSDYVEVKGVMLPKVMKITSGPQVITFTTTEIKINEGVSEEDFK